MNLSKIEECSHLCLFCLRQEVSFGNSKDLTENFIKFKTFTNTLFRYAGSTNKEGEMLAGEMDIESFLLSYCKNCLTITNVFCEVYHKFKCLELELEWKIWTLVKIMEQASKVPSRAAQLDNVFDRSNVAKSIRLEIIQKCNKKLSSSQPRVLLQNIKSPMPTSSNIFNALTNAIVCNQSNDNKNFQESEPEDNLDTLYDDDDNDFEETKEQVNATQEESNPSDSNFTPELNSIPASPTSQIIENFVMMTIPSLHVHKSEPLNKTEKIVPSISKEIKSETFENIPTSSTITRTEQRYNLREKRKRNYNNPKNGNRGYLPKFKSPSPLCSSETTSDDNDCSDNEITMTTKPSISNFLKRKHSCQIKTCNLDNCKKRFKNGTIYQNHIKLHSQGSFPCKFCPVVNTNLINLSSHEYKEHNTSQKKIKSTKSTYGFNCPRCPFRAIYSSDYQAHFAHTHFSTGIPPPKRQETWKCDICNMKIGDRFKDYHYKTWHIDTSEDNEVKRCEMKRCSAYFLRDWQLQSHYEKEHKKESQKESTFQCHICLKTFPQRIQWLRHKRLFHNITARQKISTDVCKMCSVGKVIKINSEIHFRNFHQIREGVEPHKCDQCPAYFRKPFQLQGHKLSVHQPDNKCKFCGKYFTARRSLNNHLKHAHKGMDENPAFPFGCELDGKCRKRFETEAELGLHQKYGHLKWAWHYERKKKYSCEKCDDGMDFGTGSNLQKHLANVHGNRRFVCEECGKAFKIKGALDTHMIFHKGPDAWNWECGECGKKCATKQKFEEHGRTHTKEKPFVCQFCGERYAHRHNWRNHLKGKHGDEKGVEEEIEKGKRSRNGNYAKRKGSKKGDCIMAK